MPIDKKTSVSTIIKDFIDSKNPKFAGKSKEERKKMALGAYYGMHREALEDCELVLIEELLTEDLLHPDHPLYKAIQANTHSSQQIHSIRHVGDSQNGKYGHVEIRIKDKTNPNAVRIKKAVVDHKTGDVTKSTLSQHLTDVRHLDDEPPKPAKPVVTPIKQNASYEETAP